MVLLRKSIPQNHNFKTAAELGVRHHMNIVRFGSEPEHIKIQIPESFSLEGWAQTSVEIKVNGFRGVITPYFNTEDFALFLPNLRKLYESLKGNAEFIPLEKQLVLNFEAKSGGHISVSGTAWSQASYENRLEFCIEIDQSYLQDPLKTLERLVKQNKSSAEQIAQASQPSVAGQFLSRSFVVLLRKSIPQNYNLKTAA